MRKIIYISMIIFIFYFALYGCNKSDVGADYPMIGTITIVSDGEIYTPLENWIFSQEKNGPAADGARKQPQEVVNELAAIPYKNNFQIVIDGEPREEPSYTLYNDKYEKDYYGQTAFTVPRNNGEYILFVELIWGNDESYSGYQYCFKLIISNSASSNSSAESSPQSEATPPLSSSSNSSSTSSPEASLSSSSKSEVSQQQSPVPAGVTHNASFADDGCLSFDNEHYGLRYITQGFTRDSEVASFTTQTAIEGIVWEVFTTKEYPNREYLLLGEWLCWMPSTHLYNYHRFFQL